MVDATRKDIDRRRRQEDVVPGSILIRHPARLSFDTIPRVHRETVAVNTNETWEEVVTTTNVVKQLPGGGEKVT